MTSHLLLNWIKVKEEMARLAGQKLNLEAEIYKELHLELNTGSTTIRRDGFKISISHNESWKVDQELAAKNSALFKQKLEMTRGLYNLLTAPEKATVSEAVTIGTNKPTFKIEAVDEN